MRVSRVGMGDLLAGAYIDMSERSNLTDARPFPVNAEYKSFLEPCTSNTHFPPLRHTYPTCILVCAISTGYPYVLHVHPHPVQHDSACEGNFPATYLPHDPDLAMPKGLILPCIIHMCLAEAMSAVCWPLECSLVGHKMQYICVCSSPTDFSAPSPSLPSAVPWASPATRHSPSPAAPHSTPHNATSDSPNSPCLLLQATASR